jgi:hypothetical protein
MMILLEHTLDISLILLVCVAWWRSNGRFFDAYKRSFVTDGESTIADINDREVRHND